MFWSRPHTCGTPPALRAHTATMVDNKMVILGGTTESDVSSELYIFDTATLRWSMPQSIGDIGPHRAHTASLLISDNDKLRRLFVFGGGHDTAYFNSLYILNLDTFVWSKPEQKGDIPGSRRGHTANVVDNYIYVFGGGDGNKALNDVWRLDADTFEWKELKTTGKPPLSRGYHTSAVWHRLLVIYGGSDGVDCFGDIHVLNLDTLVWSSISHYEIFPRLSHSCVLIGDIMVILCGHDGTQYVNEPLFFNLRRREWVSFQILGIPPTPRGYHSSVYHDCRIVLYGGFDGGVYNSTYTLDLGMYSYLASSKYTPAIEDEDTVNFRKRL